ncbi:hypothetical protein ANO11243_024770 [Dothideomycetidae sp. 11243]|nr:hypothetical protein ANO11243_024770 [fungal sp. No.11243]
MTIIHTVLLSFKPDADPKVVSDFGLTHGMTLEFESEADRDFYVKEDPAHLDVVARLKDIIADVRVIDFTPGTF